MKRRWKIVAISLCAAVLLTVAYAAAAAGSEGDPLVTLSYLKNIFTGEVQSMIDQSVGEAANKNQADMDAAIQEWDAKVNQAVQDALNRPEKEEPASFVSVSVAEGKSASVEAGCEIIVRSGAPTCSVSLIDQTDGSVLAAGKELKANHLYLATEKGTLSVPTAVVTGVVTADPSLSVRAGAGTSYERLGYLPKGTTVTIVDTSASGWYMVTGGGLAGYVSSEYIELNPATSSGPVSLLLRGAYNVQ